MGRSTRLLGGKRAACNLIERDIVELLGRALRSAPWALAHGDSPKKQRGRAAPLEVSVEFVTAVRIGAALGSTAGHPLVNLATDSHG